MFQFAYLDHNLNVCCNDSIRVELKLDLPNRLDIDELIHRLLSLNDQFSTLILYNQSNHDLLRAQLNAFLRKQNQLFYDDLAVKSLDNFDKNTVRIYWSKLASSNQATTRPAHQATSSNSSDLINARDYHKLMHSHLMPTIVEREKEYALQLNKLLAESPANLIRIQRLKREQKAKFISLIKKLNEHYETNSPNLDQILTSLSLDMDLDLDDLEYVKVDQSVALRPGSLLRQIQSFNSLHKLEESYTIQLGAQLKTTHNLRLTRCNIYDFCAHRFDQQQIEPHAIQTALSLYSNKLCALVLLTTKNNAQLEDEFAANWTHLTRICDSNGGEFHFQSVEEQKELALKFKSQLNIGDFFVTKHSNLSEVHVVFHLTTFENDAATNDGHNLKVSDLSSRHPVILGLRNILKECVLNDIQTLTFPLLLTHEMTEEMTISWVMKRAELVLKCIKGFMIEFVNWGAQESRTLQFVVPQGLMDETFDSLRHLIPTIFRESRTVNLV